MDGKKSSGYDRLAWFYERYWAREYHGQAYPVFERLALGEIPPGARVLDLCCGTGHLTRLLIGHGFKAAGIDCSAGMLAEARKKEMPGVEWIEADVRDFRLPPVYVAALCGFEGISHILEEKGLAAAFGNAYAALASGGIFVFDLNTTGAYTGPWQKHSALVEEDHLFVMRGSYDPASALATTEITAMRRDRKRHWQRDDIRIRQRGYDPETIGRILLESGFRDVACQDAESLGMRGDLAVGRVFFKSRKE